MFSKLSPLLHILPFSSASLDNFQLSDRNYLRKTLEKDVVI